jgi:hypothetical protein
LAALILLFCANDLPIYVGITATACVVNAKATAFTPRFPFGRWHRKISAHLQDPVSDNPMSE